MTRLRSLTKAKFKTWLESKPLLTIAGRPGNCATCPIAMFVASTQPPNKVISVDNVHVDVEDHADINNVESISYNMPKWTADFIHAVDNSESNKISVRRCLNILETV